MRKLFYALICILICACTPVIEESDFVENQESEMRILTRSSVEINYPMVLYAFDITTGNMAAYTTVSSDTDDAILYLPKGNYQIVALTGLPVIDKKPALNDVITLSSYMDAPIQMGSAAVYATQNSTVSIMLYNQVSAVDIMLSGIPTDATDVSVSLSILYGGLSYNGAFSGNNIVTVSLEKDDDVWRSNRFYVLPTYGNQLTLSITIATPDATNSYGYTHSAPFLVNTPYSLVGTLSSGFAINSTIDVAGWNPTEEIEFLFGDTLVEDNETDKDDLKTFKVSSIPLSGELWNNHFVAATEEVTDTTAILLLLSTTEWSNVSSAYNADTPGMAVDIIKDYCEDNLSGWSIPTRADAKLMRTAIGAEHITITNEVLSANAVPILQSGKDSEGNSIRYLCDDATYSFVWDATNISKCGTKRTYHLRAVKKVKVKK